MSFICDNEFLCFCEMTVIFHKDLFLSNGSLITYDFLIVRTEQISSFLSKLQKTNR